jgi:hypothetical protein
MKTHIEILIFNGQKSERNFDIRNFICYFTMLYYRLV